MAPLFQRGNPGGPGRPRGSKNAYPHSKAFREALRKAWDEFGDKALKIMAREDPSGFCKLYAHLEPREIDFTHTTLVEIGDEELSALIAELRERLRPPPIVEELPTNGLKMIEPPDVTH